MCVFVVCIFQGVSSDIARPPPLFFSSSGDGMGSALFAGMVFMLKYHVIQEYQDGVSFLLELVLSVMHV